MADDDERFETRTLSPFEWRVGWLRGILVFAAVILGMFVLQSRFPGHAFALPVVLGVLPVCLALYFWPSKVTLLEDGLTYRRYGVAKFVPYARIRKTESVQRLGGAARNTDVPGAEKTWTVYCALRLHLEGGQTLDIGTSTEEVKTAIRNYSLGDYGSFGAFSRTGWNLQQALDKRIHAVHDAPEPRGPIATSLVRGDKSVAEWLSVIDATAPARGDAYRGTDGSTEALWRVVEDADSPREARAAAALALRSQLDDEGRHRMRVVAVDCDSPKLRVALETALDEDAGEPRVLHALEQASLPREE